MNLSKLTNSRQQGKELVYHGITAKPFFYHFPDGEAVRQNGHPEHLTGDTYPAFTKGELDAMIGPQFGKPDFWEESRIGNPKAATDPLSFPVFFPASCVVYSNPAQASAAALIYLLENEFINAADANARHKHIFQ